MRKLSKYDRYSFGMAGCIIFESIVQKYMGIFGLGIIGIIFMLGCYLKEGGA